MQVAIVHDDLVQWGGAERVLLAISEVFPEAPIYTSVYDDCNACLWKNFGNKKVITSFLQGIPGWRFLYKALLPLYPIAFEQFDFSGYDLVISQTTRFAKSVITKPETQHVCYCHTPPRFLWNFSDEKVGKGLLPYLSYLRIFDWVSAARVDRWIAGSENCRRRIRKVYGRDAEVLHPFADDMFFERGRGFNGGYYLVVSRLKGYKNIELAVQVFNDLGYPLKIVGTGPEFLPLSAHAKDNIEFLGFVSDETLATLIAGCKAIICVAEEDFGLASLEAQALGKPVIAYAKGGALETVVAGKTGVFFDDKTSGSLREAVMKLGDIEIKREECVLNARRFSKKRFKDRLMGLLDIL